MRAFWTMLPVATSSMLGPVVVPPWIGAFTSIWFADRRSAPPFGTVIVPPIRNVRAPKSSTQFGATVTVVVVHGSPLHNDAGVTQSAVAAAPAAGATNAATTKERRISPHRFMAARVPRRAYAETWRM